MSSVFRGQGGKIEGVRQEVMDEGTERHPIVPARRKVVYLYVLQTEMARND